MSKPFRLGAPHAISIFVGGLAIVVAVNAVFVTYALRSFPGEDEPKSYVQGLRFNETLRERAQQKALGWTATAQITNAREQAVVEVQVRDARGAPLDNLSVTGLLRRPTSAKLDRELQFKFIGNGRYAAPAQGMVPGQWMLSARAQGARGTLDLEKRLLWGTS